MKLNSIKSIRVTTLYLKLAFLHNGPELTQIDLLMMPTRHQHKWERCPWRYIITDTNTSLIYRFMWKRPNGYYWFWHPTMSGWYRVGLCVNVHCCISRTLYSLAKKYCFISLSFIKIFVWLWIPLDTSGCVQELPHLWKWTTNILFWGALCLAIFNFENLFPDK